LINITYAKPDELAQVKSLFSAYASSIGIDLTFQDFDRELAALPGEYTPPSGCILLAKEETEVVGCVALRRVNGDVCEMKRLYVKPAFREKSIGRKLSESVIGEARARGYRIMKLDTLPSMREALRLYESLGFRKITPYRHNPVKGAVFMQLDLTTSPFS
jgi:ribosomal protein S18 acetylase RimI-like enzyme